MHLVEHHQSLLVRRRVRHYHGGVQFNISLHGVHLRLGGDEPHRVHGRHDRLVDVHLARVVRVEYGGGDRLHHLVCLHLVLYGLKLLGEGGEGGGVVLGGCGGGQLHGFIRVVDGLGLAGDRLRLETEVDDLEFVGHEFVGAVGAAGVVGVVGDRVLARLVCHLALEAERRGVGQDEGGAARGRRGGRHHAPPHEHGPRFLGTWGTIASYYK